MSGKSAIPWSESVPLEEHVKLEKKYMDLSIDHEESIQFLERLENEYGFSLLDLESREKEVLLAKKEVEKWEKKYVALEKKLQKLEKKMEGLKLRLFEVGSATFVENQTDSVSNDDMMDISDVDEGN